MSGDRGAGRPRKWASNAERMRAYRARQRERYARLVDPADAPDAIADNHLLCERIDQLIDERDRLWAQILRLQAHIGELERAGAGQRPAPSLSDRPRALSRTERRRRERERARQQRRR